MRGGVENMNAALEGLTMTPNADWNGQSYVRVSVSDLGNAGGRGKNTTSLTVAQNPPTIEQRNDAPDIVVPDHDVTIDEDTVTEIFGLDVEDVDQEPALPFAMSLVAEYGTLICFSASMLAICLWRGWERVKYPCEEA